MIDPLHYIIYIDSCVFYPPQQNEKEAINKLFELEEKEIIDLQIAEATEEEMQKAPAKLRDKVNSRIISADAIGTQEERKEMADIRNLLFPKKTILDNGEQKDVRNIFCAQKYGCCLFVTVDRKDILSKARLIKEKLRMNVVSPTQCLAIVLDRIEWNKKHAEAMKKLRC